ncbi:hypothetical protein CYLTODRAFT_399590 [Cylindrobasidium torrendii FP15055 ss-10]|uniref:Peptidase C14 caspase domain-containing protein n=1 Tax=Cylindrobasidium torrendii FP15055 ss-10 TaxID=1314674 RepID=A0A0D7B5W4_9AGAR|nr:hypothetical protein CYLTODRAFT_399590 [Cylindrobasidium torrendii FP15055 ss-10]
MFLPWLGFAVEKVADLLWYLVSYPPPGTTPGALGDLTHTPVPNQASKPNKPSASKPSPVAPGVVDVQPNGQPAIPVTGATELVSPPAVIHINKPAPTGGRIYALLIGIDKYASINSLAGAVNDLESVRHFLLSTVHVPPSRIRTLRDSEATRAAILESIEDLASHRDISADDPILIYYAGHGALTNPKIPAWKTRTGSVGIICPHDFALKGSKTTQGLGVFDFELGARLEMIARNKSDNITVIFDCCHSASGTRAEESDQTYTARGITLPENYVLPSSPAILDGGRAISIAKGFEQAGLRSHVLLAACNETQVAKERGGRGVFTSSLLDLLEKEGFDKLTYSDCIEQLPDLPGQNPQCEGLHRHRTLFDGRIPDKRSPIFRFTRTKNNTLYLQAGQAHQISVGTQFKLFSDARATVALGDVEAEECGPFRTRLSRLNVKQDAGYAMQTSVPLKTKPTLRLFIEPDQKLLGAYYQVAQAMSPASSYQFELVDSIADKPDVALRVREGLVEFHIGDTICQEAGLERLASGPIKPADQVYIGSILQSAANFFRHLRHKSPNPTPLSTQVTFSSFRLRHGDEYNERMEAILEPMGNNLIANSLMNVDVSEEAMHGFRIDNSTAVPLYAALFYFSMSSLAISCIYQPGTAADGSIDFSLKERGALTIGYGDGGWSPTNFSLPEDQDVDVGYLKLYLSTAHVDWSDIAQDSPFDQGRIAAPVNLKPLLWDTLTIPVVQKKQDGFGRCFFSPSINVSVNVKKTFNNQGGSMSGGWISF